MTAFRDHPGPARARAPHQGPGRDVVHVTLRLIATRRDDDETDAHGAGSGGVGGAHASRLRRSRGGQLHGAGPPHRFRRVPGMYTVRPSPTVPFAVAKVHVEQSGARSAVYYDLPAVFAARFPHRAHRPGRRHGHRAPHRRRRELDLHGGRRGVQLRREPLQHTLRRCRRQQRAAPGNRLRRLLLHGHVAPAPPRALLYSPPRAEAHPLEGDALSVLLEGGVAHLDEPRPRQPPRGGARTCADRRALLSRRARGGGGRSLPVVLAPCLPGCCSIASSRPGSASREAAGDAGRRPRRRRTMPQATPESSWSPKYRTRLQHAADRGRRRSS